MPRETVSQTWWEYVRHHAGSETPLKDIGTRMGVHPGTVGRWEGKDGARPQRPDAAHVVAFARAYKRSAIEALIAAGYLDLTDVNKRLVIELPNSLKTRSVDELLGEIRSRIPERLHASRADVDHLGEDYLRRLGDTGGDGFKQQGKRA